MNGWQVTGIGTYQTGKPNTISSGLDNSLTNIGADRGIYTGVSPARP